MFSTTREPCKRHHRRRRLSSLPKTHRITFINDERERREFLVFVPLPTNAHKRVALIFRQGHCRDMSFSFLDLHLIDERHE